MPTTSSGDHSVIRQLNGRYTSIVYSGASIWYQINISLTLENTDGRVQKTELIYVREQLLYTTSTEYENIHWPLSTIGLKDAIWEYLFQPVELITSKEASIFAPIMECHCYRCRHYYCRYDAGADSKVTRTKTQRSSMESVLRQNARRKISREQCKKSLGIKSMEQLASVIRWRFLVYRISKHESFIL
jgi:hypothetical protein